jgi:hypothetical protein
MVSIHLERGERFYGETPDGRRLRSDLYRYTGNWQELYDHENECWVEVMFAMKHIDKPDISLQGVA